MIERVEYKGYVVNIDGQKGNAFALMGLAKSTGRDLGWPEARVDAICEEMQSGDYINLLKVFDRELGHVITLQTDQDHILEALS